MLRGRSDEDFALAILIIGNSNKSSTPLIMIVIVKNPLCNVFFKINILIIKYCDDGFIPSPLILLLRHFKRG